MKCGSFKGGSGGARTAGTTLVELMIAVAIASIVLAMGASLWVFGSRSFIAMGNYADLDNKSRSALDLMSRELRQATQVIDFQKTGTVRWLTVTNSADATQTKYTWDEKSQTLLCQKTGEADQVYLTGCERWDFELYQRTPQKGGGYVFFPATNATGGYDVSICKLVNLSWKCSRSILGNKVNTESVQTAQVVLRNKQ